MLSMQVDYAVMESESDESRKNHCRPDHMDECRAVCTWSWGQCEFICEYNGLWEFKIELTRNHSCNVKLIFYKLESFMEK
jgi:hypothetical protein